jgi:acylphosphatase
MTRRAETLRIQGRVQGVGYRWWTVQAATGLGLEGWVRNRHDGSVEILAIGEAAAIGALQESCRQGPPAAVVLAVERYMADDDGSVGFEERPTV